MVDPDNQQAVIFAQHAAQYYTAARFMMHEQCVPACGNLFHHAIEMALKGGLHQLGNGHQRASGPAQRGPREMGFIENVTGVEIQILSELVRKRALAILITLFAVISCAAPVLADTLNSFRRAHGLTPLHVSRTMQAMAQRHASSMAARQSMDHDGFYSERGPAGARAENVALGCATESCAISMWENSTGHRANMLLTDVRSYGLASAVSGRRRYWCLVLGP
jgi:hypothetical protein